MPTAAFYGQGILGQYGGTAARRMDWVADTVKGSLHTNTYTPDFDAHDFHADLTNEVTGTNYTAGGVAITGKTLTYDSATNETRFDCDDPTYTNITVASIRKLVFYKVVGTSATDPLLWAITFDGDSSVTAANFVVTVPATGIAKITS